LVGAWLDQCFWASVARMWLAKMRAEALQRMCPTPLAQLCVPGQLLHKPDELGPHGDGGERAQVGLSLGLRLGRRTIVIAKR